MSSYLSYMFFHVHVVQLSTLGCVFMDGKIVTCCFKNCPAFKENMITLWTGQSDTQRQRRQVSSSTCIELQMGGRNERLEILHLPNNRTPPTLMATTIPEMSSWGMKLHNLKSFLIFHNKDTQRAGHLHNWAMNEYCWNDDKSKNGSRLFGGHGKFTLN